MRYHVRHNTSAFVIRIWPEAVDQQGNVTTWRGSIEHVTSGKRLYFDSFEALVDFIRAESGLRKLQTERWWQSFLAWLRP